MSSLLIKNGLLVDTEWMRHEDILITDGKVVRIAPEIRESEAPCDTEFIDAAGKCVLPGLIDAHTHYHLVSRGTVTADSFPQGSRCAAFGGVTTVVDFADHNKKIGLPASTDERLAEMKDGMAIDYSLHQGVYGIFPDIPAELDKLVEKGVRVIKIFTTYRNVGYLIEKRDELTFLFKECKKRNMLITCHCEDDALVTEINDNWKGTYLPKDHADLRPAEVEARGISYVGGIALELDMPLYVVHLSSKAGLEEVRRLRGLGAKIFVETTPTYLFLDRSKLEGKDGSLYVMTPPLRTKADNEALLEALSNGEINVIATDHCSFTREQKLSSNDTRTIYPGIPGTEEMFPLVHTFAAKGGKLSLQQLVSMMSTGPAKIFGLYPEKGAIKVGSDADIVIFDPDYQWTLSGNTVHSASGYTPYEGKSVIGKVTMTYLRGHLIMGDDIYLGMSGSGKFIPQNESVAYKY